MIIQNADVSQTAVAALNDAQSARSIDFSQIVTDALNAALAVINDPDSKQKLEDVVKNVVNNLVSDIVFIVKKKESREFNEDDARVFLEDQKMVARIRIRSIAIIGLQMAERIWNAIAGVFRAAINTTIGWNIL